VGVAVSQGGDIIVADFKNNRIREIPPSGEVATVAGSSSKGLLDGQSLAAQFNHPCAVAVTQEGFIVTADSLNNSIRVISPTGKVTTLAGGAFGDAGYIDGLCSNARFNSPQGVAVDHDGNIIVADTSNHCVRIITPVGQVSTLAGSDDEGFQDGQGNLAEFNAPTSVAIDCDGNIIVADNGNHSVRKVTPEGKVSTVAGNGKPGLFDGVGSTATFLDPISVATDGDGSIVVADRKSHQIRMISPDGQVATIAGRSGEGGWQDGVGQDATFQSPCGLVVDGNGDIIVTDTKNHRIRKIAAQLTPPNRRNGRLPPLLSSTRETEMAAMLEDPSCSDVVFQIEHAQITAHKNVLASRSEYFKTMFSSAFKEGQGGDGGGAVVASASSSSSSSSFAPSITIGETTPSAFKALLRYLYTDEFEFKDQDVVNVMRKAKEYQLDRLYNQTVRYCHDNICEANVVVWLIEADEFQLEELRASTLTFFSQNLEAVRTKAHHSLGLLKEKHGFLLEVMLG
jgi:hypothetical protein